jgi:mono/diheme cytochrome c family protein
MAGPRRLWFPRFTFGAILALTGVTAGELPPPASAPIDFQRDVQPIFAQRCYGCHGPALQTSGFRLDDAAAALKGGNSGPAIKPGDSASSPLILRAAHAAGQTPMPPGGAALTPQQIGILRAWIDQGAKWPQLTVKAAATVSRGASHWSFQPVRNPAPPMVQNRDWVRNPIDAFILERLERERIQPSPEADKPTLLRRLSLDLTGLPPTPREVANFLNDNRPDGYERQVDRLLESPHYGERRARFWLDLARYGDSDGYEKDWVRPHAWRYREWVINALNVDMPFDEFTIEQLAGDLLPNATVEQRAATGFHRNTLTNREGGVDNEQFRFDNVIDRAATTGTVWLGLTVGCAQCHDHKFDPTTQKDFYRLAAFFDNVEETEIDAPLAGELGPWLRTRDEYRKKRQELLKEYHIAELQKEWEAKMLDAAANPGKYTDWDLAWDVLLKLTVGGDGEKTIRKKPQERTEREQDVLTDHFIKNYAFAVGDKKYKEVKFKELDEKLTGLKSTYPQLTQASVISESGQQRKSYIRLRGNYKSLGVEVQPGTPEFLGQPAESNPTRLDLARWLVSGKNPLTARVAINRFWQELFGQGLVRTSEDFGLQGDRPTHPELLDWLAGQFMEGGWSMKRIQKLMVLSATYRQSSQERPELQSKDPGNVLLARQSRLRLPAELIRDEALAVSGLLSPKIGGPSVRPLQPSGVAELGYAGSVNWEESKGEERYRRGLYIHFQRTTPYPLLINFDAPRGDVPVCRRLRSDTPLQALNLLNDPVFLEAAQALAFRLATEGPPDLAGRLRYAYQLALNRNPEPVEQQRLQRFFEKQKALFGKEPQSTDALVSHDATGQLEQAAWVTLSSVLLNLDEFITRE